MPLFYQKKAVFWQGHKASPFFIAAQERPSIPAEGADRGNIFYSNLGYNIELGPIFTARSALHALIVTATIFADILTQIIYRIEAQETKQALAPRDSESQAGCHIASCDTQKTLIYGG